MTRKPERAALVAVVIVGVVLSLRPDPPLERILCAELPPAQQPCKVTQHGDWYLVEGRGTVYLELMQDGKVIQSQRVQ